MPIPILNTKLYSPPSRPNSVKRAHLIEILNAGLHRKLTLITAPAGFGKTTLVSEWIDQSEYPVAWLSLDENDSDPIRFLTYFLASLQTIHPQLGEDFQNLLQSPQPPPIETLLTTFLNEITTITDDFILVLDDYHILDNSRYAQSISN
jgi:LuxR family transcriptional regulator, maltose regulon positive regulatory protein